MINVSISVPVFPTENRDRVISAMKNVLSFTEDQVQEETRPMTLSFEDITYDLDVTYLVLVSDDTFCLHRIQNIINKELITETARKILYASLHRNHVSFNINKQAALAGKMHFAEEGESPLGPIHVEIETDDPEGFIAWLTSPPEAEE
jgi:hypothetical protein